MANSISFEVIAKKKYPEVCDAVKEYFNTQKEEMDSIEKNNGLEYNLFEAWMEKVEMDPKAQSIYRYELYGYPCEDLYSMMCDFAEFISKKVPDSEFEGRVDFFEGYNSVSADFNFSYKKKKLTEDYQSVSDAFYAMNDEFYEEYEEYDEDDEEE